MRKFKLRKKLMDVFPACCFFVVTFCLFMPCSLFLENIDEFPVDFGKIVPLVLGVSLIVISVLLLVGVIVSLFDKEVHQNYAALVFGCAGGFYLQGNFMNPDLGELNGNAINWTEYRINGWISITVWILCLVIPQIFIIFRRKIVAFVIKWGSYYLTAVQVITLIVLIFTSSKTIENDLVVTKEGQFQLSKNENIIIFVIDTLDAVWFEDVVLKNGAYEENLKDFTYFDNAVSGGAPTVFGYTTDANRKNL